MFVHRTSRPSAPRRSSARLRNRSAAVALAVAGVLVVMPAIGANATPAPVAPAAGAAAGPATAAGILPAGARLDRPVRFTDGTTVLTARSRAALSAPTPDGTLRAARPTAQLMALRPGDVVVVPAGGPVPTGLMGRVTDIKRPGPGLEVATEPVELTEAVDSVKASYSGPAPVPTTAGEADTPGVTVTQANAQEFTVGLRDYVLYDIDGKSSTSGDQMRANGTITFAVPTIDFNLDMVDRRVQQLRFVTNFQTLRSNLFVDGEVPTKGITSEQVPYTLWLPAIPVGTFSFTPAVDVVVSVDGQVRPRGSQFFNNATMHMSWGTQLSLVDPARPVSVGFDYTAGSGVTPVVGLPSSPGFSFTPVALSGDDTVTSAKLTASLGVRPKVYLYGVVGPNVLLGPAAGVEVDAYDPAQQATPFQLRAGVRVGGGISLNVVNQTDIGLGFNLTVPVYSGTGTAS